ncbi:putative ATP-dependent protease LA, putative [Thiobacillus denitrificans ATCC 25259]|uniref:Putative ATP-dependent protease LA, putative n=1 Tax=Thiobacillus denitrificans (strain ATCC 25259 / T1) TaxID=292415 RepID=Q3SKZ2_THIDA|nr:ATP-binding protein [Thiobacillus denitrificans]AAZ96629.1 putative ATP-dependent protease LA, putative [Thiobacillus denitrificans ATCC 25259]
MTIDTLPPSALRLTIDPASLGFADTSELQDEALPWIGQARAEAAATFGLGMGAPDYNLFVLGEVGSGRSSLLRQAMHAAAATRRVPPDLCYLHNFDAPERPLALRLPAGQGRALRQQLADAIRTLQSDIPQRLQGPDYKAERERIEQAWKDEVARHYADLTAFAEARSFSLHREGGRMVFTLTGKKGQALTEDEVLALPKARRIAVEEAEQELRAEISRYIEQTQPLERAMNEALARSRRQFVKPLVARELQAIRSELKKQIKDAAKLNAWLDALEQDLLDNLEVFDGDEGDDGDEQAPATPASVVARYRVNLVVDNGGLAGAPVVVEDNPVHRTLFGSIEYQSEADVLMTDFSRIRAGSLLQAHGGFLMLHLRDVLADPLVWERLRRFLRSGRLQIEEPGVSLAPLATMSLAPEPVDVEVKIVLVGSREQYYALQDAAPEFMRHFRAKVDFADSFLARDETRRASAIFVAHACRQHGLPHFSPAAVARLLEESHREADDQARESAIFAATEALVLESAAICRARGPGLVLAEDVEVALVARAARHDYPEQRLRESIADGDVLIALRGAASGQINALTQVDLGDARFGLPVRVSARTYAGEDGVLNIAREVELSGPVHDKGVFILQSYLAALFGHLAPLSLDASIIFEQQYQGVEGDSASCAEFYALVSALSGVTFSQGIAVTGALNQHGEVLPVGGINEKIEGWFRVCETAGLDGRQGVLIPARNRRHLMLAPAVVAAVAAGRFHVHTAEHVLDGLALLSGLAAGEADAAGHYPHDSVLGRAEAALRAFREACEKARAHRPEARRSGRR